MTTITKEEYLKLKRYHCDKDKHRYRENKFGIVWCTICGRLGVNYQGELIPLKEEDKLVIDCK